MCYFVSYNVNILNYFSTLKGNKVNWLPFAECPMVERSQSSVRWKREEVEIECPDGDSQNAETKCQSIIGE